VGGIEGKKVRRARDRDQASEDRGREGQKSEVGGQRTEDR
jgi:hypothetical protein